MSDQPVVVLIPVGESGEVHSTLVAFDVGVMWQMRNIISSIASFCVGPAGLVMAYDTFGSDETDQVEVAVLEGSSMRALYDLVAQYNVGPWGYAPHITKQPGYNLPAVGTWVEFDRIAIWRGEERSAWRFGTGSPCAP